MAEKHKIITDIEEIKKKYNKVIASELQDCETLKTGLFSLDEILGSGIPLGRLISIHGANSTGKSLLAAFITSVFQKTGKKALWVDAEGTYSPSFYQKLGVDTKKLEVASAQIAEECLDMIIDFARVGAYDLIVLDSVASLVPKNELEASLDENKMSELARVLSRALRIIVSECAKTKTTIILLNQVRKSLSLYGSPTTIPGGEALKFYASIMLELKKGTLYESPTERYANGEKKMIGNEIKIEAKKNKVGIPGASGSIDVYYDTGVDYIGDAFTVAVSKGIIEQAGASYSFRGEKIAIGKDKALSVLRENKALYQAIYQELEKLLDSSAPKSEIQEIKEVKKTKKIKEEPVF